ncbi:MAG TPA: hypothetical protein VHC69_17685 [Polyangiaceae bacterium]|nr:hypothetical protein [Polyangiaceae bacterium]
MPSLPLRLIALSCGVTLTIFGCNAVLGLDKLSIDSHAKDVDSGKGSKETPDSEPADGCKTNRECITELTTQGAGPTVDGGTVPAVCVKATHQCVALLSDDCNTITGDYTDDNAVILGTLFSTQGAQAATNIPRQRSAQLAVEEINSVGGVPGPTIDAPRSLVLVSCDESTNLLRAGGHLITELHVPAIVGPNTSQDTLDLSNKLSIAGGTVVMTPTGVASSIADLMDDDLTWLMVPSDVQRAPLMISQINALETQLKQARNESQVKLGVIYRNDALGVGTRTSLDTLTLNGQPLSTQINAGGNVKISPYDYTQPDQSAIVGDYLKFLPDIIVLAGTAEAITNVMVPLEKAWPKSESDAGRRPSYVLIDSVKVPDLITAVTNNDDLRHRIRGTGVTPSPASAPVYNAFQIDFSARYMMSATTSGMGPSYDALYGIAYALAATKNMPATGKGIAAGLRMLAGGTTTIQNSGTKALAAFQKLAAGDKITAIGTFGPMEWDMNGAVVGGTLEMWCISGAASTPTYQSSGLTYDIKAQTFSGTYAQCGP